MVQTGTSVGEIDVATTVICMMVEDEKVVTASILGAVPVASTIGHMVTEPTPVVSVRPWRQIITLTQRLWLCREIVAATIIDRMGRNR